MEAPSSSIILFSERSAKIGVRRVNSLFRKSGPDPNFLGLQKIGSGPDFRKREFTRLTPIFASSQTNHFPIMRSCFDVRSHSNAAGARGGSASTWTAHTPLFLRSIRK